MDTDHDPLDRATVLALHLLSEAWGDYTAIATTEPLERAITRLTNAGLVEAGGTWTFTQPGSTTRLVVNGRWSGKLVESQVIALVTAVPEWYAEGRLKGVAFLPEAKRVRLTGVGITAQGDVRSRERQHIVLELLAGGAADPGKFIVEAQRIERPLPPESRRL